MQQRPDQGDGRQRRQRHEERAGFATRNDLVRDESQHHGRHQHDQAPEQPGHQEARGVGAQPYSGEPKQIPGPGLGGGQRPIEEPRVASKRFGTLGRDLGVAPFDRVDFPIATEHAGKQGHGPAVIRPKRQHRARVADPPLVVLSEPYPPSAHAGRVQGVVEESGGIGRLRPCRPLEVDALMAADDSERVEQSRIVVADARVSCKAVKVEQALPGAVLI